VGAEGSLTADLVRWYQALFPPTPEPTAPAPLRASAGAPPLADHELLVRARAARNGSRFDRLWSGDTSFYGGDHSRADLALCGLLHFWTGGDRARVDHLFRCSALMRPKWDERRGARTYGERTLDALCLLGAAR